MSTSATPIIRIKATAKRVVCLAAHGSILPSAACFGVVVLYSAADGSMDPWAAKQTTRFAVALILMIGVALVDIRHWFRIAYWAYAAGLALVIAVDMRGFAGMGAQRWIDLGVIQLQPSALMNVTM